MTTFFTSDLHLGHAKIIEYAKRPFLNVKQMDKELIARWNSLVKHDDVIYHLGDLCFGDPNPYLDKLNGKKRLMIGDHDSKLMEYNVHHREDVTIIAPVYTIKTPYEEYGHHIPLTLCHWAMRSWPLSHYGSWHLFGHHHGSLPPYGKSFDVGVDADWINFFPVSMDSVKAWMDILTPVVDYRDKNDTISSAN